MSRLHLEIPQIYVVQRPRGYISPHLWQTGVPVAFLNYDLNSYQHYGNTSYKQHYLALNGGINLGDWAFRHIGAKSWDSSGESSYHRIATYVKRPIVPLRSELTVGDFTTDGAAVEAIGLRGVRLASDDRMLPTSLRGYAPTVRGIAHSNARVTISQNGHIIRQLNVPAGAFEISDLNPTGYSGELHVEVLEASGDDFYFFVSVGERL